MVQPKNYYSYLKKFSPGALRKYQTGYFFDMGRRSHWDILVKRFAVLSLTHENYIFVNRKLPNWIINILYGSVILLTVCWSFIYIHGPSEPTKYLETTEVKPRGMPSGTYTRKINYQDLYDYQRKHATSWI